MERVRERNRELGSEWALEREKETSTDPVLHFLEQEDSQPCCWGARCTQHGRVDGLGSEGPMNAVEPCWWKLILT